MRETIYCTGEKRFFFSPFVFVVRKIKIYHTDFTGKGKGKKGFVVLLVYTVTVWP